MADKQETYTAETESQYVDGDIREHVKSTVALAMNHLVPQVAREVARAEIEARDRRRQVYEDSRANHRNLNRFLTLMGALFIGLAVTWSLQQGMWGHYSKILAPYSFVITIVLDSGLALYAFIRKY